MVLKVMALKKMRSLSPAVGELKHLFPTGSTDNPLLQQIYHCYFCLLLNNIHVFLTLAVSQYR